MTTEMTSADRKEKDTPYLGGGITVKYRGEKWELPSNIKRLADVRGEYIRITRGSGGRTQQSMMVSKKLLKEGEDGFYIDEDNTMQENMTPKAAKKTIADLAKIMTKRDLTPKEREQAKTATQALKGAKFLKVSKSPFAPKKEGTMLIKGLDILKKKVKGTDKAQLDIAVKTLKMPDAMANVMGGPSKDEAKKILKTLVGKYGGSVTGKKEGEEVIEGKNEEALKKGLGQWVLDYRQSRKSGNVKLAKQGKANIDKSIKKYGLDAKVIYAHGGGPGVKEDLEEGKTISWKNVDKSKKWHLVLNGKPLPGKYEDMYKAQSGKTRLMKKTPLGPDAKYTTADLNKIEILPIPFKSRAEYEKHMKSQQEGDTFLQPGMEGSRAALKSGAFIKVKEISQPNITVIRTISNGSMEIGREVVVTEKKLLERVSQWVHLVSVEEAKVAVGKWNTKGDETITVHSIKGNKATISGDDAKKREMDVDALKYILKSPIKEAKDAASDPAWQKMKVIIIQQLMKKKGMSKGEAEKEFKQKYAKESLEEGRIKLKDPISFGGKKKGKAVICPHCKGKKVRQDVPTKGAPCPSCKGKGWINEGEELTEAEKKTAVIMRDMSGKWYAEVGGKKIDSDQDEKKLRGRLKGKYELSEGVKYTDDDWALVDGGKVVKYFKNPPNDKAPTKFTKSGDQEMVRISKAKKLGMKLS